MNNYAYFNAAGEPCYTTSYCMDEDIPALPEGYRRALITNEVFPNFYLSESGEVLSRESNPSVYHTWDMPTLTWVVTPDKVSVVKADAAVAIDNAAGKARQRYITTSPGQDATYTVKYQEALDYIAAGYPEDLSTYPYIAGESSPNTWMTATQAATRIAVLGGYWRDVVGPAIEKARVNGKESLEALTDPHAIDQRVAEVIAEIDIL